MMLYVLHPLGVTQWECLRALLEDGGQLTTLEIAEAIHKTPKRTLKALHALRARNLVNHEVAKGCTQPPALWTLRVSSARTKET